MRTTYRTAAMVLVAGVFTAALTYATVELPAWLAMLAADWVDIPDLHPAIEPEAIRAFIESNNLHLIAWVCLAAVGVAIVAGIVLGRRSLATAGAIVLFLPTLGSFAAYMFFLAGLGVLRVLWLPAWEGGLMALGDVAYVPYMAIVWPLSLAGVDARGAVALAAITIGLFVFVLGTTTWLVARFEGRDVADSFIYRWSRHPQYAGWMVWSWGLMLVAAQQPVPMAGQNPGAALAWTVSTLVIVAVAWAEERTMLARAGPAWVAYRDRTPFLVPAPDVVARAARLPIRLVTGQPRPATGRQILAAFLACLAVAVVLSIPFAGLAWPPYGWWAWPTFAPPVF